MKGIQIGRVRLRLPLRAMTPDRAETVARLVFEESLRLVESHKISDFGVRELELVDPGPLEMRLREMEDHQIARHTAAWLVQALRTEGRYQS